MAGENDKFLQHLLTSLTYYLVYLHRGTVNQFGLNMCYFHSNFDLSMREFFAIKNCTL